MSRKTAILVASDTFTDPSLPPAPFAEADARALAAALEGVGFTAVDRLMLTGSAATKTAVESRLRQVARGLSARDEVHFFYSGHGFSAGGKSCLACRDTLLDDLAPTSLILSDVWSLLRTTHCRLNLFLDAAPREFAKPLPEGVEAGLSDEELADWLGDDTIAACFVSARSGEVSHVAGSLKRRVWSHHLIEAFTGSAREALTDGLLTAGSLQTYLEHEVPRTLRKVLSVPVRQTPAAFGKDLHLPGRMLADLNPVLASRKNQVNADLQQLRRVVFRSETRGKVKDLSGYQKGHRVPDQVTPSVEKFITRIAADDVRVDVEETFNALRE